MPNKIGKSLIYITALIMIFSSRIAIADNSLTIEQAIEQGLQNNYELKQNEKEMEKITRDIQSIKASLDWQVDVNSNYAYANNDYLEKDNINNRAHISLDGSKRSLTGLNMETRLTLIEASDNYIDPQEKYEFYFGISRNLYPDIPTEEEKNIILLNNRLSTIHSRLIQERKEKRIEWLRDYYKLLRMYENKEVAANKKRLAEKHFEITKKKNEINEAGIQDELTAKINLQEAELEYRQINHEINQAVNSLKKKLGLGKKYSIVFNEDDDYLEHIREQIEQYSEEFYENEAELFQLVKENNIQLSEIEQALKYEKKKYKWQQEEEKINIAVNSNYEKSHGSNQGHWNIGLECSYNIFDGGQQQLSLSTIEAEIDNLEQEYRETLRGLRIELQGLIEQIKMNKMKLDTAGLKLDKKKLETEMYEEQYNKGYINNYRYEQELLAYRQAKINYKSARDELLFSMYRVLSAF